MTDLYIVSQYQMKVDVIGDRLHVELAHRLKLH